MRIAVVGARGNFGKPVARRLRADGHEVVVFSRRPDKAMKVFGEGFHYGGVMAQHGGSLLERWVFAYQGSTGPSALKGFDALHVNMNLDYAQFVPGQVWNGWNAMAEVAKLAGVRRISLLAGDPPLDPENGFMQAVFDSSGAAVFSRCGIPYTIFHSAWFMESLPWFIDIHCALIPGRQTHRHHWVAAEDYSRMVSRALVDAACENKFLVVHGPESVSIPEAVERFCRRHYPDLQIEERPLHELRMRDSDTYRWQRYLDLMAAMERTPEMGDPTGTNSLLGKPATTLDQWIESYVPPGD